jgi:hypothetical protein
MNTSSIVFVAVYYNNIWNAKTFPFVRLPVQLRVALMRPLVLVALANAFLREWLRV